MSQIAETPPVDLIELFIPSNPFHSFSEGLMPAIVLFCLLFGFVLIGDERNKHFVDGLNGLLSPLYKVTNLLVIIAPVGIFAIMASTIGTITFPQLFRFRSY